MGTLGDPPVLGKWAGTKTALSNTVRTRFSYQYDRRRNILKLREVLPYFLPRTLRQVREWGGLLRPPFVPGTVLYLMARSERNGWSSWSGMRSLRLAPQAE